MMIIEKKAMKTDRYYNNVYYYQNARTALKDISLNLARAGRINKIVLPGYIGWSPKEGSGIFDAMSNIIKIPVLYYKMTQELSVDLVDLEKKIDENSLVLLVNYFGFKDRKIKKVVEIIKQAGAVLVEDNAHGFFTYHTTEHIDSDFVVFSLHKMFPHENGGCMYIKNVNYDNLCYTGEKTPEFIPYHYDIYDISLLIKKNFCELENLLFDGVEKGFYSLLRTSQDLNDSVPQTYPILINNLDRFKIYQRMNDKGYGVISLYHTLVPPLKTAEHKEAQWVSERILNLPIHQDVQLEKLKKMVDELNALCEEFTI